MQHFLLWPEKGSDRFDLANLTVSVSEDLLWVCLPKQQSYRGVTNFSCTSSAWHHCMNNRWLGCKLQCQTQLKLPAQYPAHLWNPSENIILHGGQQPHGCDHQQLLDNCCMHFLSRLKKMVSVFKLLKDHCSHATCDNFISQCSHLQH